MPDAAIVTEKKTDIQEEKKVPTGIGKTERIQLSEANIAQVTEKAPPEKKKTEGQEGNSGHENGTEKNVEITDDILREYFKKNNINFEGDTKTLKEKLEYVPPIPTKEPTPEEIAAKEIAKEKKILDLWTAQGGKPEDFYNLKKLIQADGNELTESEIRRELKAEGFTKEEQDDIIKHRYFQMELDSIEQEEDESEEDFTKRKEALEKKVKYGAKKLANRSTYIKNEADKVLKNLAKEVELQEKDAEDEIQFTKTVDEFSKALPTETAFEINLGESLKVDAVKHKVSDTAIQKAKDILKNREERNNFLFTKEDSLNLQNIFPLLVNYFDQQEIYSSIYAEATDRNTKEFKKQFPYTRASALGIGGVATNNTEKGKIASAGKVERVAPTNT